MIGIEFGNSMREDVACSFKISVPDNDPVPMGEDRLTRRRFCTIFNFDIPNLLSLTIVNRCGMYAGKDMVEVSWLSSDEVIPVFRAELWTVWLSGLGISGEVFEDGSSLLQLQ